MVGTLDSSVVDVVLWVSCRCFVDDVRAGVWLSSDVDSSSSSSSSLLSLVGLGVLFSRVVGALFSRVGEGSSSSSSSLLLLLLFPFPWATTTVEYAARRARLSRRHALSGDDRRILARCGSRVNNDLIVALELSINYSATKATSIDIARLEAGDNKDSTDWSVSEEFSGVVVRMRRVNER